ncbi:MAG: HD domain-containing protein [Candidatus Aenigmatarchaeota archaeon]
MEKLIKLAEKIENKKLREKVIEILKEPSISNSEIIYPISKLEKVPAWVSGHHNYEGGLIDHIESVTNISLMLSENFEKMYKIKINKDYLIAGALLHDIMKVFILKKEGRVWNFTGTLLDHAFFSAAELYARNFPEEVIHIVASHGGDLGAAGANPRTLEALIVFYADMIDAGIESQINSINTEDLLSFLIKKQ